MQAQRCVQPTGTNQTCGLAFSASPGNGHQPFPVALRFSRVSDSPASAGGHRGGEIPVPIPNTEVKPPIAEGSAGPARARVGRRRLFILHSGLRVGQKKNPAASAHPLVRPSGLASPKVHSPRRPSASQMILRASGARIGRPFFCVFFFLGVIRFRRNMPRSDCASWILVGHVKKREKTIIANSDYALAA